MWSNPRGCVRPRPSFKSEESEEITFVFEYKLGVCYTRHYNGVEVAWGCWSSLAIEPNQMLMHLLAFLLACPFVSFAGTTPSHPTPDGPVSPPVDCTALAAFLEDEVMALSYTASFGGLAIPSKPPFTSTRTARPMSGMPTETSWPAFHTR